MAQPIDSGTFILGRNVETSAFGHSSTMWNLYACIRYSGVLWRILGQSLRDPELVNNVPESYSREGIVSPQERISASSWENLLTS